MALEALLVSGSLRTRSTNSAALLTLLSLFPSGISGTLYGELGLLPPFNPDRDIDPLPATVAGLRARIHRADVLVISTPEYAGALPGALKNLLDWTIGDGEDGSIWGKRAAWLNVSPRGAPGAHAELRTVLGYAHASIIEGACVSTPVTQAMIGGDGQIKDPLVRRRFATLADGLVDGLRRRSE